MGKKIARTYRFEPAIVAKLRELAGWKRRDMTAQLTVMIETEHTQEARRREADRHPDIEGR